MDVVQQVTFELNNRSTLFGKEYNDKVLLGNKKTIEIEEFMLIFGKYSRLLALIESKCMSRILLFQSQCY